ncbi:NAD-dependent epimerase/dehydratase family protein [Novosphingobium sp.]|uniref:NAD-dependent epimerase/dehydratase family protein n=1 Tax=Novosphingobium sp. TaxID=1874826 RepID=UPI003D11C60C
MITGAGGFVGAATARAALAAGHTVMALVRRPDAWRLANLSGALSIHVADLSDDQRISRLLFRLRPDVVIHSAWEGVGGPARAGDIQFENIRTTLALTDAAIAAGVSKFVGFGSQAEYGRFDRRIVETDLPQPTMLYGAAKLSACHLVRQRLQAAGVDFAWLRLFSVFGPEDNPNWLIPSVAAALVRGNVPRCTPGTQKWDYLHIDDVASATLATAITDAATGVFNLSSGQPVTIRAIVERLRDLAAPGLALRFGDVPFGPDQIMHLEGDNTRLRLLTGWDKAIDTLTGLADVVNAMRVVTA